MNCGNRWVIGIALGIMFSAGSVVAEDAAEGWTGDVAVAITAQSGTTNTFSGNLDAKGERTAGPNQLGVRFNGVYGTSKQSNSGKGTETIQNSQALWGDWRRTIHERFFWLTESELSRDNTQNRELRAAVGTGPGYRLWLGETNPDDHFDMSFGVGYRYEIYDGTAGASDTKDHFADVIAGFEYRNQLFGERIDYTHTGSAKMPVNDTASYVLTTEALFGVPLTEAWSFRTGVLVEYVANPGSDDVKNLTTRTTVGLGYKF